MFGFKDMRIYIYICIHLFLVSKLSILSILIGTLWEKLIKNKDKKPLPVKKKSHSLLRVETSLHAHSADGLGRWYCGKFFKPS